MRFLILLLFFASSVSAQPLAVTNTFSNNTVADAEDINQNFTDIVAGVNERLRLDSINANVALGNGLGNNAPDMESAAGPDSGRFQVSVGWNSLLSNTAGGDNTAIGAFSMYSNTLGHQNVAVGNSALEGNISGENNTALGAHALRYNVLGSANTAIGSAALYNNSGSRNTAIGKQALYNNTTGYNNTACGTQALFNNTTGIKNHAGGFYALRSNTTGNYNTALGYYANVGTGNLENATAIGYNAIVDASNKVRIGNPQVKFIEGEVAFTTSSDARLKDSVTPVSEGLALINDLNPVSYHRVNNPESDIEMGLLAQEVEATLERHGLGNSGMVHQPTEDSYMSLRYNDLLAPMIKAIQELDDASEAKDAQIASLQEQLRSQQEELLAIVPSQQEQIAQLQRMVEHQFAMN